MKAHNSQSGAALLSILLIVATLSVAALIATETIARQTELQKLGSRHTMAIWAARSAEAAVMASAGDLMSASRLPATEETLDRVQTVALPVDGGQVILNVRDLPACLNLNALGNPDPLLRQQQATALAVLLGEIGIPSTDAASLIAGISDWVDADAETQPTGAEDAYYLTTGDGFRAGNQSMLSHAELAVIPGFTPDMSRAVSGVTCALPEAGAAAINVNALGPDDALVLSAATGGALSVGEAVKFIEGRPIRGWTSDSELRAFTAQRPSLDQALASVPLSVQSVYFTAYGRVQLDSGSWPFRFLLKVQPGGAAKVVWRAFGDGE